MPQDLHQSSVALGHPTQRQLKLLPSQALHLQLCTLYKLFSVRVQDPPLNMCSGGGSAPPCSSYLQEAEVLPVGSLPKAATSSSHQCQENTALFHTVLVYLS